MCYGMIMMPFFDVLIVKQLVGFLSANMFCNVQTLSAFDTAEYVPFI